MTHKEFTVHDRLGPLTITGTMLSDARFGSERKVRWTDMALYQVIETERDAWFTMRCRGCVPRRMMLVSTDSIGGAPQKCEACGKIFDLPESPFSYALEITARSWVYHRIDGPCVKNKHKVTTVADVWKSEGRWERLVPCNRCKPQDLQDMQDSDRIAEERQDQHVYFCSTPEALIRRIYHHSGEISDLAAGLLREAARKDPKIARAMKEGRRI